MVQPLPQVFLGQTLQKRPLGCDVGSDWLDSFGVQRGILLLREMEVLR